MAEAPVEDARPGYVVPRWGFGDVAITLLGTLVVGTLVASLAFAITQPGTAARAWATVFTLVAPWSVLAGWPIYASKTRGNGPVEDFGLRLTWRNAGIGVLGGVAALILAQITALITVAISGHSFNSAVGTLADDMKSARAALVVLGLLTIFGAPVVEELAFRGLTFGALRNMGQPVPWSVVWSGLVFALFHFELIRLPLLLVIGLVLGTVRAYTGSTAASMVAHATVNLAAGIAIMTLS